MKGLASPFVCCSVQPGGLKANVPAITINLRSTYLILLSLEEEKFLFFILSRPAGQKNLRETEMTTCNEYGLLGDTLLRFSHCSHQPARSKHLENIPPYTYIIIYILNFMCNVLFFSHQYFENSPLRGVRYLEMFQTAVLVPCVLVCNYMVCPISAIFSEDKHTTEPAHKVKNALSIPNTPEPAMMQEPLVGSQKRKARKTKITHLVRTADGRVSPAGGTLGKKRELYTHS